MAQGVNPTSNNHLEIYYTHPWGGVSSEADPSDIAPSQLVRMDNVTIRNGVLGAAKYDQYGSFNFGTQVGVPVFPFQVDFIVFNGSNLYVFAGKLVYIYNQATNVFILDQTLATSTFWTIDCYQVVAGVFYLFDYVVGQMYVYTPTVSYVVGETYVAGQFVTVLDQQMLTANSTQPTDTPPIKPNRINWSAPDSFTTWDPAANRLAGFDVLQDVQDQITGIFTMGNVGYVLRSQGLTQLTPTGIAIQPFNFTPMWTSAYGIGCTYPKTFSQYGPTAIWANDNNIYAFGGGMPQEITGTAKNAIYSDINANKNSPFNATYVSGCFANTSVDNDTPELVYILCVASVTGTETTAASVITWEYNIKRQTWTRQVLDAFAFITSVTGAVPSNVGSVLITGTYITLAQPQNTPLSSIPRSLYPVISINFIGPNPTNLPQCVIAVKKENYDGQNSDFTEASLPNIGLQFRQEEIKLFRQPTIRRVLIKAAGRGILNVSVSGIAFSPIQVNSVTPIVVFSDGIFTGQNPQLSITSNNFDGYIVKTMMAATYADGETG